MPGESPAPESPHAAVRLVGRAGLVSNGLGHGGVPWGNGPGGSRSNLAEAALVGALEWSAGTIAARVGEPSNEPSFASTLLALPGGHLLVVAAARYDPAQPTGLDAGLRAVADEPYGPVLLVVLALGMLVFALHCLFDARYRKE